MRWRSTWYCTIFAAFITLKVSPAMAAGVTDTLWSLEDVIAKIDEMAPAPKPRGPYK